MVKMQIYHDAASTRFPLHRRKIHKVRFFKYKRESINANAECELWSYSFVLLFTLLGLHGNGLRAQAVAVAEEQNAFGSTLGVGAGLNPLAPACAEPQSTDETPGTIPGIRAVVLAHDRLDGLGGFIGIIEGDGADIVVKDVSLNDAVEQVSANKAHLTINSSSSSTDKIPLLGGVVRQSWVSVLEEGDGN